MPPPDRPKKPKDPARPTRAKAAREPVKPLAPALAELLNPGIGKGTAGVGAQTGIEPGLHPEGFRRGQTERLRRQIAEQTLCRTPGRTRHRPAVVPSQAKARLLRTRS